MAMMALATAAVAAGGQAAAASAPVPTSASLSDRSSINIAPVGVNLGSILQPMFQGAATNGGTGIVPQSRWSNGSYSVTPQGISFDVASGETSNMLVYGGIAVAGLLAFFLVRGKK